VNEIAEDLFKAGKIKDKHEDAPLETRLTLLEEQFPSASILLHKRGFLPKEFQALWTDPRLMSVARQLLGGAVVVHILILLLNWKCCLLGFFNIRFLCVHSSMVILFA
jgi:hypothetical protein